MNLRAVRALPHAPAAPWQVAYAIFNADRAPKREEVGHSRWQVLTRHKRKLLAELQDTRQPDSARADCVAGARERRR